jgi:hypothetical protein
MAAVVFTSCVVPPHKDAVMERIVVAPDGRGFVFRKSKEPFRPWGFNYGNAGRLIEDFWHDDWQTIAGDFREMKGMGANVVRVHLQFEQFMKATNQSNAANLKQLRRLLDLAESTGLYLDLTGLACYRPSDRPKWYDELSNGGRWNAQANFWRAIAAECAGSPAVFCYNLMNEPIAPGQRSEKWHSGHLLGGYDFLQYIARDPAGTRSEVARAWIRTLSAAIREEDPSTPITVGMLSWVTNWKHLSGFVPREVAPHLDFLSVHIYPKSKKPDEAPYALRECVAGKPVVIEETFPLECSVAELEAFLRSSRDIACGWIWHYDGFTLADYDAIERAGKLTAAQRIWRDALKLYVKLTPEFAVDARRQPPDRRH